MLARIRQGTDNILVKIILWLIALSFVGIGGAAFVGGNNGGNIVEFDKIVAVNPQELF